MVKLNKKVLLNLESPAELAVASLPLLLSRAIVR
jgi:hypothetical protein